MEKLNWGAMKLGAAGALAILLFSFPLQAQTAPREELVLEKIQELQTLRKTDPAAFQEIIRRKKEKLGKAFGKLQGGPQENYKAFLEKEKLFRQKQLAHFKSRHPQTFERFMDRRIGELERARERNPERFQKFMTEHPRVQNAYEKRRVHGPRIGPPRKGTRQEGRGQAGRRHGR